MIGKIKAFMSEGLGVNSVCLYILFVTVSFNVSASVFKDNKVYSTWTGLEGDKWATVWLILKQQPQAQIKLFPIGTVDLPGIPFDVPMSNYRRNHRQSTFTVVAELLQEQTLAMKSLTKLVDDLEINAWRANQHPFSALVKQNLKVLDQRFAMQPAAIACYVAFFDSIYLALEKNSPLADLDSRLHHVVNDTSCHLAATIIE